MKKLLFTSLLGLGLLLPATISAADSTINSHAETGFSAKKIKKSIPKKKRTRKRSKAARSRSYTQDKGCTYNGNQLFVGKRGGCYYYSGSSKRYVDRAYCSGCN